MPTINGFDLQIQIRRKTAEFHGVVIDKMARTAECYLQAVPGDPFAVSWQCKKTAPPTRGDVWVDGAWVGARRIDCSVGAGAGAGADEARFARVLIHREQRDREGEAERRKLVFRKSAMREAERGDDGGVRAMGDVFGVGGGSGSGSGAGDAGGDGTDVGAQMVVLGADMVSCGLGEVRLVINRVASQSVAQGIESGASQVDDVVLERMATFVIKYRSREFLFKNHITGRPRIDKDIMRTGVLHKVKLEYSTDPTTEDGPPLIEDTAGASMYGMLDKSIQKAEADLQKLRAMRAKFKRFHKENEKRAQSALTKRVRERVIVTRGRKRDAMAEAGRKEELGDAGDAFPLMAINEVHAAPQTSLGEIRLGTDTHSGATPKGSSSRSRLRHNPKVEGKRPRWSNERRRAERMKEHSMVVDVDHAHGLDNAEGTGAAARELIEEEMPFVPL